MLNDTIIYTYTLNIHTYIYIYVRIWLWLKERVWIVPRWSGRMERVSYVQESRGLIRTYWERYTEAAWYKYRSRVRIMSIRNVWIMSMDRLWVQGMYRGLTFWAAAVWYVLIDMYIYIYLSYISLCVTICVWCMSCLALFWAKIMDHLIELFQCDHWYPPRWFHHYYIINNYKLLHNHFACACTSQAMQELVHHEAPWYTVYDAPCGACLPLHSGCTAWAADSSASTRLWRDGFAGGHRGVHWWHWPKSVPTSND